MSSESDNKKKLNDFFGKEYHSLKRYVRSKITTSINRDAEDIIQDVALKLFAGADRYSPINNVTGFVYFAIKNKIIDIMRSSHKRENSDDVQNENKLIEFAELLYNSADYSYPEQMKEDLKKAIFSLKPDYRDIILAIDFEGYTYKEIALETNIPIGTLMSRRHRAIALLHKKIRTVN